MANHRQPGSSTGVEKSPALVGSSGRAALPESREGYAIDVVRATLHRRYARHAIGLPRARSEAQVRTYLGSSWNECEECWPPAPVAAPSERRSLRRQHAELVAEREQLIESGADPTDLVEPAPVADETAPNFGMQPFTRGAGDESTPEEVEE